MVQRFLPSAAALLALLHCAPEGAGGFTRLMRAAASGEAHSVKAFLAQGADPNATDGSGRSALSLSAQFGRDEIVTLLVEAGAAPDLADASGVTPLMQAARFGHEETVAILLAAGAEPSRRDDSGRTVSDWAEASGQVRLARELRELESASAP